MHHNDFLRRASRGFTPTPSSFVQVVQVPTKDASGKVLPVGTPRLVSFSELNAEYSVHDFSIESLQLSGAINKLNNITYGIRDVDSALVNADKLIDAFEASTDVSSDMSNSSNNN